ncbi:hypothetical protein ACJX0J_020350, partial [Zea mays]
MGDILIPSLMVGDCSHSLCVRVSRLWEFLDPQDDSRLLHTDLVLLDEEGNSIHAQVYPPLCQQFSALLDDGGVYNLKYFLVRKANRFYKPVENCNMISFTKWTTVDVVLQIPLAFPVCTYNLTPIEQLQPHVDYKEYFTDVLGVVSVVSHVSSLRTRGRQAEVMKRTVTISNARYKISLTAEDDTDTAEFIFFGRMAQRLIKKNVDTLISTNPPDFIPKEITNLLEKYFEWNVSFTESTIIYGNVSFQVNAINAEMDGGNILPTTPSSQPSSTILSQGQGSGVTQNRGAAFIRELSMTPESHKVSSIAKGNIQTTPHQGDNLLQGTEIVTSSPNVQTPSGAAYSVLDGSTNKAHKSVTGK